MIEALRKFGLSHCDLATMFSNVATLLRVNSINIDRSYKKVPKFGYFMTTLSFSSYLYVCVFSMLWFCFVRCRETGDLISAAVAFSVGTCSGPAITKFLYMKICPNVIMDLVEKYKECDSLVVPGTRYAANLLKKLRIVKRRATVLWLMLIINGLMYISIPLLRPGRHLIEDLYIIYGLEPMFETPNYEIATVLMFLGVYFAVCTLTNAIVFIVVLVGYLESQLLTLSEELEHIWDDSKTFYLRVGTNIGGSSNELDMEDKLKNTFVSVRLRDIIKFHIMCINLRDRLEKALRVIFVGDFLLMILGIVSELIGQLENTYLQMPYTFVQAFMECFIGQKLMDASVVFEEAVYACQWENFDVANQKTVLIMLQSSQRTLTISAGGIAILSFTCLMNFMKTTYSAYTTMQTKA